MDMFTHNNNHKQETKLDRFDFNAFSFTHENNNKNTNNMHHDSLFNQAFNMPLTNMNRSTPNIKKSNFEQLNIQMNKSQNHFNKAFTERNMINETTKVSLPRVDSPRHQERKSFLTNEKEEPNPLMDSLRFSGMVKSKYEGSVFDLNLKSTADYSDKLEDKPIHCNYYNDSKDKSIKGHSINLIFQKQEQSETEGLDDDKKLTPEVNLKEEVKGRSKLKYLGNFFDCLFKLFCCEDITETDLRLSGQEFEVLSALIYRKFMKRITIDLENPDLSQIKTFMNKAKDLVCHKRPEECNKFLMTRAFKFLKTNFNNNFKGSNKDDSAFYDYYFKNVAERDDISLDSYHYPVKGKSANKLKTVNSQFFKRIFSSTRFTNDLIKYILECFKQDYKQEIAAKLIAMLKKWELNMDENGRFTEKGLKQIKTYLLKNQRCKLPWTLDGLKDAVFRVHEHIKNYGDKDILVYLEESSFFK